MVQHRGRAQVPGRYTKTLGENSPTGPSNPDLRPQTLDPVQVASAAWGLRSRRCSPHRQRSHVQSLQVQSGPKTGLLPMRDGFIMTNSSKMRTPYFFRNVFFVQMFFPELVFAFFPLLLLLFVFVFASDFAFCFWPLLLYLFLLFAFAFCFSFCFCF